MNIENSAQNTVNIVKQSTLKILSDIPKGEKTTFKDLIDKVVAETRIQISIANGLVAMIVHEWEQEGYGSIEKGRNGGIYPGGKEKKIDKRLRCESCHQVLRTIKIT